MDFFASLLAKSKPKKARKRFGKALKTLQGSLGKLNDIAVHEKMARRFAHPGKRSKKRTEKALAMGLVAGREQREARACLAATLKAGENLSKAHSFWK
jgi:CHAD domain-containing protein